MKRLLAIILIFVLILSLCACKKKEEPSQDPAPEQTAEPATVYQLDVTLENIYDFFDYKEYKTYFKDDNGNVTSVQISYGLALKPGYVAANDPELTDTMEISFTADGIVNSGTFDVDFDTMQYSGTVSETSVNSISQSLKFWPKGSRTIIWPYGVYSSSYVIYLQNFHITEAKGTVYIKLA